MLRSNSLKVFFSAALPALEALVYDELQAPPDHIPDIFRMDTTDRWGEQYLTYAGLGATQATQEGEEAPEDQPIEGYSKTLQPVDYALRVGFTKDFVADEKLNIVQDTYRQLGQAAYQCKQIAAFNVINDGYATTTGPDATYLFSTSHSMIGGHTFANRPSSEIALSIAGLSVMEIALRKQVNHRNLAAMVVPEVIVIPPDLWQTAYELDKSDGRPDTPNRSANAFQGRYTWITSPYLTSTTAWAAMSKKNCLVFLTRQEPEVETWYEHGTRKVNTIVAHRFDVGYYDFVGTWGTTG